MQKTILVVDDSAMIRRIVGQILQQYGYRHIVAENGLQGWEKAKKERPDLIIMDIEMPEMDGFEASSRIKADPETAHIPVLFFTSLSREEDIHKAERAGGQGFLNKPVAKEDLLVALAEIFGEP